jgi:hypothetical protein
LAAVIVVGTVLPAPADDIETNNAELMRNLLPTVV